MKESLFAIIILSAVIFGCIYTSSTTAAFCDELKGSMIECMNAVEANNWDSAKEHIGNAKALFKSKSPLLKAFSMHQDINDINVAILKIDAAISLKSRDMCVSEANGLIGQLDKLSESDLASISNIL